MSLISIIIVFIFLVIIVNKSILIVPEGSIVKTFVIGKAGKSYGSGMHVGWFDRALIKQVQLKPGMLVTASSENSIETGGFQIPAKFLEIPRIGTTVRIDSFEGFDPVVTSKNVPNEKLVPCEKCGHINKARV